MITMETSTPAVNLSVRVSRQLKTESEMLFRSLGMNMTTAIQCFLRQSLIAGGLPFEVRLPLSKRENFEAWMEAKEIAANPNHKSYTVDEAFAELER